MSDEGRKAMSAAVPDPRERRFLAKLAEWKLKNPKGTVEDAKRDPDLLENLIEDEDDIQFLIDWNRKRGLN